MNNPNKKRLRRTMMFLNAQKPGLIKDPYIYKADSLMLDLEDAVAENQKDVARFSLYHALKTVDYRVLLQRHPERGQASIGKGRCRPGRGSRPGAGSLGRSGRRSRAVRSGRTRGNAGHCAHRGGGAAGGKERCFRVVQGSVAAAFPGRNTGRF